MKKILSVEDVAAWHLCCGCGACAFACSGQIEMVDAVSYGRRPRAIDPNAPANLLADGLAVCPGISLTRDPQSCPRQCDPGLYRAWGPVLDIWEGHAADPEIHYRGASGGLATALALCAIETAGMHGTLHIKAREDIPFLNRTTLSTTREQLLETTGSRYAPASPCDGLHMIENAPGNCAFIGKPCDVVAVRKTAALRPALSQNLGITIAFFCGGTPSTLGTLQMMHAMGVRKLAAVRSVRYRGYGWPGKATVDHSEGESEKTEQLTYDESWGDILQKRRQWRCYICPDHTGEHADIAVADAWHRNTADYQPGRSLVIARTETGRQFVRRAAEAGYLVLDPAAPEALPKSRPGQTTALGALWGRLLTLKCMGVPVPQYEGVPLLDIWLRELSLQQKIRSVGGTVKRTFRKKASRKSTVFGFGSTCT